MDHYFEKLDPSVQLSLTKSILTSISDGVIVSNKAADFLIMNQAAKRIAGIPESISDPSHWTAAFSCLEPDGKTPITIEQLPLYRAAHGESIQDVELLLKNDYLAEPKWVCASGHPLQNFPGGGGVVIFRDITAQKKMHAALLQSNDQLQQFAYIAAHDLQEPLRTITSYLNLLVERYFGSLDEKAQKYVNAAASGATRMQTLISDLLAYSRLSTAAQHYGQLSLKLVLQDVVADLRSLLNESGAAISIGDLPTILGDRTQMRLLFQNLISNAIKYRSDESPVIEISSSPREFDWLISVKDNGIGFEMEYSDKIFQIFKRLHGRTEYPGNGIGLAVCKLIVEQHGGSIWTQSVPGQGSTFQFSLPMLKER